MRAAVILLAAVAAGSWAIACGPGREASSPDARTAVSLTAEQRNAVLVEMRTMLASIKGVLDGAARSDSAGIRGAAQASGTSAAADPALERLLPADWLRLAEETHGGFDRLAASAGAGRDTVVGRLGAITSSCVSCHAMYRLAGR